MTGEEKLYVVDTSLMALVVTVDQFGNSRVISGLGYSKRQQADMLRSLSEAAERQADASGEPTSDVGRDVEESA
jgi:hypothetical protein